MIAMTIPNLIQYDNVRFQDILITTSGQKQIYGFNCNTG